MRGGRKLIISFPNFDRMSAKTIKKHSARVRKQYDPETFERAVILASKTKNVRNAARQFNVPNSTLLRRINNKALKQTGPRTILKPEEEKRIVNWILYMGKAGFPVSAADLTSTVSDYAKKIRKTRQIPPSFPSKMPAHPSLFIGL